MRIAVCDDDRDALLTISAFSDTYRRERQASLVYHTFLSATEPLSTAKAGMYDLYLLDVLMPAISGMETAKEIRDFEQDAEIIFLTASPEFAVESYRYRALDYLLKPVRPERLFPVLDGLQATKERSREGLSIKTKTGMARILFERLAYVEVAGRAVSFHLSDGTVRETVATLADFEEVLLARPEFVRPHRSYLVNLMQVAELNSLELTTLTGARVPVSRHNCAKVRDAYVEQLFQRKEGSR